MSLLGCAAVGLAIDNFDQRSQLLVSLRLSQLINVALAVEGIVLLMSGGQQLWRLNGAVAGSPLVSCDIEVKLVRPRDEIVRDCITAMMSMHALSPAGGSLIHTNEKEIAIQGGTRGWATRGRGSRVCIKIEDTNDCPNGISGFKVLVSSECYRAELFDLYKTRRNVKNILAKLLA